MQAIGPLTGTEETGPDFSIFTGDLTSHDYDNQYSRFVFSNSLSFMQAHATCKGLRRVC